MLADRRTRALQIAANWRHVVPGHDCRSKRCQRSDVAAKRNDAMGLDKILRRDEARPMVRDVDAVGAECGNDCRRWCRLRLRAGRVSAQGYTSLLRQPIILGNGQHTLGRVVRTEEEHSSLSCHTTPFMTRLPSPGSVVPACPPRSQAAGRLGGWPDQ